MSYSVATATATTAARPPIAQHGADFPGPALRDILAGDCPKRNASLYERCNVYFPNVPTVL